MDWPVISIEKLRRQPGYRFNRGVIYTNKYVFIRAAGSSLRTFTRKISGGLATRKLKGVIGGGLLRLITGLVLDEFKPTCRICPRTYPPRLDIS